MVLEVAESASAALYGGQIDGFGWPVRGAVTCWARMAVCERRSDLASVVTSGTCDAVAKATDGVPPAPIAECSCGNAMPAERDCRLDR